MSGSLTESVARLYRTGSQYSQSSIKLRQAAEQLIDWITKNIPSDFKLPRNCGIPKPGEFWQWQEPRPGKVANAILILDRVGMKSNTELMKFAQLIADGFLDDLSDELEKAGISFESAANTVTTFVDKG